MPGQKTHNLSAAAWTEASSGVTADAALLLTPLTETNWDLRGSRRRTCTPLPGRPGCSRGGA